MVRALIRWSLDNPLLVIVMSIAVAAVGVYSFININVEAYPDPAPATIDVLAQWPGASAEEMERQVTIPLEIALAGMPGLKTTLSKSLYGLSHLRNVFEYGHDYEKARQEVINRLQFVQGLPPGVTAVLSPANPIGEIYRYTLTSPTNELGQPYYTLNDLKSLQDWLLEREFRRVPGVIDVTSQGGTVKRYEIHPDPERLKAFGITLQQVQAALTSSNANVGGDFIFPGRVTLMVRSRGLIGQGTDPIERAIAMESPRDAAAFLRAEEEQRLREIRNIVIVANDYQPVRIDDIVEGGPLLSEGNPTTRGVVVGHQMRLGRLSLDRPLDSANKEWERHFEKVQGIILMRKGEKSIPTLEAVKLKVDEINPEVKPDGTIVRRGRLLPGVTLESYYDRIDLVNATTRTVEHNLLMGIALVAVLLLMFLSNVRSAVIVAVNIPLALLFAFSVLFLRGKSANLLSIGAVDFGIIVDSSVIMVENIYRHLTAGHDTELPLKERIYQASTEIDKALFFSTAIMVCAFLPLFTMTGAEGELFGPMAQTYAFALAGALLMALTLAPVLCLLFLGKVQAAPDNWMVRLLKRGYLRNLDWCLNHRVITVVLMAGIMALTVAVPLAHLGREFMPELDEGNLWIRAIFPVHVSLDAVAEPVKKVREIMGSPAYPEIQKIVVQSGRPDDGTDPGGFNNVEFFVPLRPEKDWPIVDRPNGERKRRVKQEIIDDLSSELAAKLPGIEWAFSQYIRDNVMEAISGVKGDNSVKIYGPDLATLEALAEKTKEAIAEVRDPETGELIRGIAGIRDVGIYRIMGQSNLEFAVDKDKCKQWGVQVADVNAVINGAVHGAAVSQMVEGEKTFDITVRWPEQRRQDVEALLEIPVDVQNNNLTPATSPSANATRWSGSQGGVSSSGTSRSLPAPVGQNSAPARSYLPRLTLRQLVSPIGEDGRLNRGGSFIRAGGSIIAREQGKRFIAVRFSVRDRDLAGAVDEVREHIDHLFPTPYRYRMGGEFEQMQSAEARLMWIVPASLALIFMLLYFAFRSLLDVIVILSNLLFGAIGGIWALYILDMNFSISTAIGFISIFGVGIMNGLLLISYFNDLRARGLSVRDAVLQGAALRVRPVMITAWTAILGLLPAAFSTEIGAQTQRPLAVVVVGGMLTTLFLTRYLMPVLYSFYGHRDPPAGVAHLAH
jgi:cobalt-zinc-cadmium resistance protein CzcA